MAKKNFQSNAAEIPESSSVAQRAYEIWQREGCPDGRAMEHWLRAEAELASASSAGGKSDNLKIRPARRSASKNGDRQFQAAGR